MRKTTDAYDKHKNCRTGEAGFTLIEVLVAIAIFSIGMLAIGAMQIGAMQGVGTARSNTELSALASEHMERLTTLPHDHGDLAAGDHTKNDFSEERFSVSWEIEEDDIFLDIKTITLTATEDLRGNIRTLTLQNVVLRID